MTAGRPSAILVGFAEHVLKNSAQQGRQPKIADLPFEVRAERLTEYSNWSCRDLELIELECQLHSKDMPLEVLIS
jgi:hypothetical protein